MNCQDSDDEFQEDNNSKAVKAKIQTEVTLLPPLLPLKFGNGFLLQYIVNYPRRDDKFYLLEVGLITGMTSLALVLLATMVKYLIKTAPSVLQLKKERLKKLARWGEMLNTFVGVVQALLLVIMFVYSLSIFNKVEFEDKESSNYVKKRIYMFSFVVSLIMFISAMVAGTLMFFLAIHKPPTKCSSRVPPPTLPHPAYSLLPLGLANAMLGLYIGIPGDDASIVGTKVFLLDLCLYIGTVTIFLTVLESIIKVALTIALRDGHLDVQEAKLLRYTHMARYAMVLLQGLMFMIMFCHTLEILMSISSPDYTCPRNLLMISLILSSIILAAGVVGIVLVLILKYC